MILNPEERKGTSSILSGVILEAIIALAIQDVIAPLNVWMRYGILIIVYFILIFISRIVFTKKKIMSAIIPILILLAAIISIILYILFISDFILFDAELDFIVFIIIGFGFMIIVVDYLSIDIIRNKDKIFDKKWQGKSLLAQCCSVAILLVMNLLLQ